MVIYGQDLIMPAVLVRQQKPSLLIILRHKKSVHTNEQEMNNK